MSEAESEDDDDVVEEAEEIASVETASKVKDSVSEIVSEAGSSPHVVSIKL